MGKLSLGLGFTPHPIIDLCTAMSLDMRFVIHLVLKFNFLVFLSYSNLHPITKCKHFHMFVYVCNVTFAV